MKALPKTRRRARRWLPSPARSSISTSRSTASSQLWIEQGIEMGRPSRIRLEMDVAGGKLTAGRIGGHAVRVAEGTLFV